MDPTNRRSQKSVEPDSASTDPEPGHSDVPKLLPARMLNEFTYCPRLFYLEWVQGEFADSADTVRGRWTHRRVDRPSRPRQTEDGDDDRPVVERSLKLSSERIGLLAVIDLVESSAGRAVPVDYKKGTVPEQGPWEPERVQLCVQALLLREHGYDCDEGVLYFAGSRRRVVVPIDSALVSRTQELIAKARSLAASAEIPPPLIDSPKCPRCSLAAICLPDEVNALSGRATPNADVRRLAPKRHDRRPLYVQEQGARVGKKGERLSIKGPETSLEVKLLDVSQVCLLGNVQISTQTIRLLAKRNIPVCHFSYGGWFDAITTGMSHKNVELRMAQYGVANDDDRALDVARRIVRDKLRNQKTLLRRNVSDLPEATLRELDRLSASAARAKSVATLLGIEGAGARAYFAQFASMLKGTQQLAAFDFRSRNRRPPRDRVNASLSFVYALLVKEIHVQLLAVGLDPYLGVYHKPRYGRPALALDLAEEFRPIVADSVVVTAINNGELRAGDFVVRGDAVALEPRGRKQLISTFERRMTTSVRHPRLGYSASYRRVVEVQARILARHLLGELPEYVPFRTR